MILLVSITQINAITSLPQSTILGNPNVTPKVTHEIAKKQRLTAAKLILHDIDKLYSQLAVCKGFSPEFLSLARKY